MKIHSLEFTLALPENIERVFRFLSHMKNLEFLTPPWVNFHVGNGRGEETVI
jgi:hypothetical protein